MMFYFTCASEFDLKPFVALALSAAAAVAATAAATGISSA